MYIIVKFTFYWFYKGPQDRLKVERTIVNFLADSGEEKSNSLNRRGGGRDWTKKHVMSHVVQELLEQVNITCVY